MEELKSAIASILISHVGQYNPIKAEEIASHFGFKSDRTIRLIIRELIAEGTPIVSRTESPAGYFVAQSWEELQEYANTERSRIIENALRIRDLKRAYSKYWQGNTQVRLI